MFGNVEALWTMAAGPLAAAALALAALAVGFWFGRRRAVSRADEGPEPPEVPVHVREYMAESDRLFAYGALIESSGEFADPEFKGRLHSAVLSIADAESGCYDRTNPIPDPEG